MIIITIVINNIVLFNKHKYSSRTHV